VQNYLFNTQLQKSFISFSQICTQNHQMEHNRLIEILSTQGSKWLESPPERALQAAMDLNPWFTEHDIRHALLALAPWMQIETLKNFYRTYDFSDISDTTSVGMILAGNIPGAGFHDVLMGLLFPGQVLVRCSHLDSVLIPAFIQEILPDIKHLTFTSELSHVDGLIASGSSLTAQYLDAQYHNIPKLLRGNRFSVAILTGQETSQDFDLLAKDILLYNGMGCRNISNLLVPENWQEHQKLYSALKNYSTQRPLSLPYARKVQWEQGIEIWKGNSQDAGLPVCIRKSQELSPVETGVLQWVKYSSPTEAEEKIALATAQLQCKVGINQPVQLGETQYPKITDFADQVDTMAWMLGQTKRA
jgi:hypothetical protein